MKKILFLLFAVSLTFLSFSGPVEDKGSDYVVTDMGITYLTELNYGNANFLEGKTMKGKIISFTKESILSFKMRGKVFLKKLKIINGKECNECTFMEKLYTRAGYTLFKDLKDESKGIKNFDFFVYYGNKYELKIDSENYKIVLAFFYPEFNKLYFS